MELALEAEVSTRHLSFVETGRSKPSRDMVVKLAEHLDVPLRERNELLLDSMTKWVHGWKKKGWKTAAGQPVKNQDLVMALEEEIARHAEVRWHWVKGHETGAEHAHKALNDRADKLAVAAAKAHA